MTENAISATQLYKNGVKDLFVATASEKFVKEVVELVKKSAWAEASATIGLMSLGNTELGSSSHTAQMLADQELMKIIVSNSVVNLRKEVKFEADEEALAALENAIDYFDRIEERRKHYRNSDSLAKWWSNQRKLIALIYLENRHDYELTAQEFCGALTALFIRRGLGTAEYFEALFDLFC
ncbi:MAG: hypothetical protein IJ689_03885 [Alphaproteobacteria bacterium]|nr:hypothetical protein [Alphaproteobacteria bacterium]